MSIHTFADTLRAHTARIESGEELEGTICAQLLSRLIKHEVAPGGPYTLVPGDPIEKADIGFNLIIARFLASCDVHLPALDAFITEKLKGVELASSLISAEALDELCMWYRSTEDSVEEEKTASIPLDAGEHAIMDLIRKGAEERFASLFSELKDNALMVVEKTIRKNTEKQIPLIAYYLRSALGKEGKRFSDETLAELGLANIFFWASSIIYDDFWDEDETAEPRLLPVANLFARHYADLFTHGDHSFRTLFHRSMDKLDSANSWEVKCCRAKIKDNVFSIPEKLPEYGAYDIKFYPASGQILGGIMMFLTLGYADDSEEVEHLISYFKHYLIGMQLNDDMHDWKDDIGQGHISTAVARLLERWQEHHPEARTIHLVDDMPELEHLFWFEVLKPMCDDVLVHARQSREALAALPMLENTESLERFIVRNERPAWQALNAYEQSDQFLKTLAVDYA